MKVTKRGHTIRFNFTTSKKDQVAASLLMNTLAGRHIESVVPKETAPPCRKIPGPNCGDRECAYGCNWSGTDKPFVPPKNGNETP